LSIESKAVVSGKQAIKELKQTISKKPYDFVLMNYRMPEMDGLEASELIRNDPELKDIKIILVTAFNIERDLHNLEETGIDAFLFKPVSPSLLYNT
jgi:two-component system, sensor histidine kinase and response regulator